LNADGKMYMPTFVYSIICEIYYDMAWIWWCVWSL